MIAESCAAEEPSDTLSWHEGNVVLETQEFDWLDSKTNGPISIYLNSSMPPSFRSKAVT